MVSQDDINLLPEDLRKKEKKIKESQPAKRWEIKMTAPERKTLKEKETSKIFWWEELKKFLTQPLGKETKPVALGSIAPIKAPVFEYEKKPPAKPEEKPRPIEIKEPTKLEEKVGPKPSFFVKIFQKKAEPKEKVPFPKEKPKPVFQMVKIKKSLSSPEKKEKPKKVSFWSKIFKPKVKTVKVKPIPKTIPPPLPLPSTKVSFWSKIFKPKVKVPQTKSTYKIAPPQTKKVSFFEKIFGPKKERKASQTFQPIKPLPSQVNLKSAKALHKKKKKLSPISFISESETSIQLKFFRKILFGEIVILIFCFLIGYAYLLLLWYQIHLITKSTELEIEINKIKEQIILNNKKEQVILFDQKRIKVAQNLLDQHIYWSNFFDLLEKYTIDEVYYQDFNASDFEKITLRAVGKDFQSMARQLVVFNQAKDFIREVKISGGDYSPEGVSFMINLTLEKSLFYQ